MRPTAEQLAQWKAEVLEAVQDDGTVETLIGATCWQWPGVRDSINADPDAVLALIDEVERLRAENSQQAQLIERIEQDEAATKTHALACSKSEDHWRAEVEHLRETVKQREATAAEQSAAIERLREKLRSATSPEVGS